MLDHVGVSRNQQTVTQNVNSEKSFPFVSELQADREGQTCRIEPGVSTLEAPACLRLGDFPTHSGLRSLHHSSLRLATRRVWVPRSMLDRLHWFHRLHGLLRQVAEAVTWRLERPSCCIAASPCCATVW